MEASEETDECIRGSGWKVVISDVSDALDSASAVLRVTRGGERVGGERCRETRRDL